MYKKGKKSNDEVYQEVLSIVLQKMGTSMFFLSGSPKLMLFLPKIYRAVPLWKIESTGILKFRLG